MVWRSLSVQFLKENVDRTLHRPDATFIKSTLEVCNLVEFRVWPAYLGANHFQMGSAMKTRLNRIVGVLILLAIFLIPAIVSPRDNEVGGSLPPRQMEALGRGVVALHLGGGKVFVSWRLLGTDPEDIAFNLYRQPDGGEPLKLNKEPIASSTNFADTGVDMTKANTWLVRPIVKGTELDASKVTVLSKLPANAPARPYISIPLKTPAGYHQVLRGV